MLSAADHDTALLASLRLMMLSGDWIPVALADRIRKQLPACQLFSLGGATEASIWSIFHPIEHVDPQWVSIPYGKPLRNQTFHVLKNDLAPCPIHTTGKLFIGGAGLAMGYWNDPEQTAARFIRSSADRRTALRHRRPGPLPAGRRHRVPRPRGRPSQTPRLPHRTRRNRSRASQHPQVQSAVALVQTQGGSQRLVAYLVPTKSEPTIHDPAGRQDGVITDKLARIAFTLDQHGRPEISENSKTIELPGGTFDRDREQTFLGRQSYRSFADQPLTMAEFGSWISCLQAMLVDNAPIPKRLYPSAGGLYPVRVYFVFKPNAVEGLDAGAYVYDALAHRLARVGNAS